MPSPTRKSRQVWLLTSRAGETERPVCVSATFKTVYAHALFEGRLSEASLTERAAREICKRDGRVWLWDRSKYSSFEEAMWSPIGSLTRIERVEVRKA